MADISKLGEKGKDILAALERVTFELPVSRILIIFLLFCDCFMVVANRKSFLDLKWDAASQTTLGAVFLGVAAFSFAMTVVAPLCLQATIQFWFKFGSPLVSDIDDKIRPLLKETAKQIADIIWYYLLHEKEQDQFEVEEEFKKFTPQWTEPPSPYEKQLEQDLVPLNQLRDYALREQSTVALKLVEKEEEAFQTSFNQFKEDARTAAWSIMAILLTALDIYLGWKNHASVLWVITDKLEQFSGMVWLIGVPYLFAIASPVVKYIREELPEYIDIYYERNRRLVFYPLLAEKLLADEQQKRREKEQSMQAHRDGWQNARPLEIVYPPRAVASATLQIAERLRTLVAYLGRCEYRLEPEVTPVRIAKLLSYENVAILESVFSGNRPLPFSEAKLICDTFGVNRKWLLDGKSTPFKQDRVYHSTDDFFKAVALNRLTWDDQKLYHKLLFVLPLGDYEPTLVYGQRDKSAYRFDLLLNNVPIYAEDSSRTGLFDFCLAAAEICRPCFYTERGRL